MLALVKKSTWTLSAVLVGSLCATSAWAADATTQALDRVIAISRTATTPVAPSGNTAAIEVQPNYLSPLYVTSKPTTAFVNCQITATGSMVCIDGKLVRRWGNPAKFPELSEDLFSCTNNALGLDKKTDTCTSLTVDLAGAIWLAGKKSSTYSLLRVTETATPAGNPTGCATGRWLGADTSDGSSGAKRFCVEDSASGRPYFEDLSSAEGDRIKSYPYGAGLAGVQTRSAIVYFQKTTTASVNTIVIASSKSILGLSGSEQVQSTALLQRDDGSSFFIYTTSTGKVRAVRGTANTTELSNFMFDVVANRGTSVPGCAPVTSDRFGVRASPTTEEVYISDRASCQIFVLKPVPAGNAFGFVLGNAKRLPLTSTVNSSVALNPESPSVSPGILVDFRDFGANCSSPFDCPLLTNAIGEPTVGLSGVALLSSESFMTLFQIKGIPDCRYIPDDDRCVAARAGLPPGGRLIRDYCPLGFSPPNCGATDKARQFLNVTPLLPSEIKQAYPNLPEMWISPQYRGQNERGYVFDALLGVPKDGVQFRDTFQLEFEIDKLAGGASRCSPPLPDLREWDVVTTVSERYPTFSNGDLNNNDTIVNTFCGGAGTGGGRWSIYSYTLEPSTDTISVFNGKIYLSTDDDAVYAKMIDRLYDDLGQTQDKYVCPPPPDTQLATTCSTLQANWANGRDKLTKCIGASTQPKQSSGDQNCQSFSSQLSQYQSALAAVPANQADAANRIGELKARTQTIRHIFDTRFLPSIPLDGFCENPDLTGNPCRMTRLY